jgi:Sulfatase
MTGSRFSRRKLLGAGAAVAALMAGAGFLRGRRSQAGPSVPAGIKNAAAKRPDVLLILSDQERHWDDLPRELNLPAHDQLRERGTRFSNYHIHTTPCSPSRSTFYFGQHTQQTKMVVNHGAPPFSEIPTHLPSLGHLMRAQGYACRNRAYLAPALWQ